MREIEVSQGVRPIGVTVLRGRTEAVVLRQLKRLQRRGYIYAASPVSRINRRAGGGYAVKVSLLRELPEPYPAWAKGIIAVGLSLTGMALLVILAAKFVEGAWITVIAIPAVILLLRAIHGYYARLDEQLRAATLVMDRVAAFFEDLQQEA